MSEFFDGLGRGCRRAGQGRLYGPVRAHVGSLGGAVILCQLVSQINHAEQAMVRQIAATRIRIAESLYEISHSLHPFAGVYGGLLADRDVATACLEVVGEGVLPERPPARDAAGLSPCLWVSALMFATNDQCPSSRTWA